MNLFLFVGYLILDSNIRKYLKRERKVLGEYEVVGAVDGLGDRSGVDGAL